MTEMTDPAIQIEGLTKRYRGSKRKTPAVEDLSLEVRGGEVFGFIGPNGAGKSTTIKCLLGFLRPTQGALRILGKIHTAAEVRRRIGYLPEVASYYHYLTPCETLWMYGRIFKMERKALRRRIEEVLGQVGLEPHADERIGTFSKGMTQRVGIAQALINDPDLLILDEPTSGLDPLGRREIRALIEDLQRRGKTVFFSSHELTAVEEVCDRVAILRAGRLVRCGELRELLPHTGGVEITVSKLNEALLSRLGDLPCEIRERQGEEITLLVRAMREVRSVVDLLDDLETEIHSVEHLRLRLEDVFVEAVSTEEAKR